MSLFPLDKREKQAIKNAYRHYIPVLIIAFVISSILVGYIYFLGQQNKIIEIEEKLTIDAALTYNNEISNLASIVYSIKLDFIEMATKGFSSDEISELFIEKLIQFETIDQLRILDLEGMEVHRVNKGDDGPYVVNENELQDKSLRYYYIETKQLGRNQFLFSNIDLNIEKQEIEINPITGLAKPTFRISTPIYVNDRLEGYMVVNFLMRDFLDSMWNSLADEGGNVLIFNNLGCMNNYPIDDYNFSSCYDDDDPRTQYSVHTFYPQVNLNQQSGSFVSKEAIHTYVAYNNISEISKDFFLSSSAPDSYYFMVIFDKDSIYGNYVSFSVFDNMFNSWKIQIHILIMSVLIYYVLIFLYFLYDRTKFTNLNCNNRFSKAEIKRAIKNNEMVCYFQPIINIQDGSIAVIEALTRWRRNGEILTPDKFFDEVDNFNLKQAIDENAFRQIKLARKKLEELNISSYSFISINISQETFLNLIKETPNISMKFTDEVKEYLIVELLEEIIIHEKAGIKIRDLNDEGLNFAVDDFGTGNSNVAFIRNFEDLKVKIDKTFLPKNFENADEKIILESFIKIFGTKDFRLIVEGVETREQYLYLKGLNVSCAQGYYFSKPLAFDDLIDYLQNQRQFEKL